MTFYIPRAGMVVIDPMTMRKLPATGDDITGNDLYWARIIRDGDVTVEDAPVAPVANPSPTVANEIAEAVAEVLQKDGIKTE